MLLEAMRVGTMLLSFGTEVGAPSQGAPVSAQDLACVTRAVLLESTIPKESELGQATVARAIVNRTEDGRWGKTICDTVNMKYTTVRLKSVLKRIKRKSIRITRTIVHSVWDISSMGMKRFEKVRGTPAQEALATIVSYEVLRGGYQLSERLDGALHWMYRAKSAKHAASWFDCVTEPIGQASDRDYHVFYKDADAATLAKRYEEEPKCRGFIDKARKAQERKRQKQPSAEMAHILEAPGY